MIAEETQSDFCSRVAILGDVHVNHKLVIEPDSSSVGDPWGGGVRSNPPCPLFWNSLLKWNNLVSVRPNYFIFIGYLGKLRWNQQRGPQHFYIYKAPFQKPCIRPSSSLLHTVKCFIIAESAFDDFKKQTYVRSLIFAVS